jgi:type II secretory pathway pseudopilin PulG
VRRVDDVRQNDESGFGLVEIIVALFMLGVLSVAFLPLLIQGLQLSADNATRATATQILHDRLEAARVQSVKCTEVRTALNGVQTATVQDPRGIQFQVTTTMPACPTTAASYPGTIKVTIDVRRLDDLAAPPLASATTLVFVKSQS